MSPKPRAWLLTSPMNFRPANPIGISSWISNRHFYMCKRECLISPQTCSSQFPLSKQTAIQPIVQAKNLADFSLYGFPCNLTQSHSFYTNPIYLSSKMYPRTSRVVQWLRLCAPNAGGPGSIPDQRTRPYMPQQRLKAQRVTTTSQCSQINNFSKK